MKYSYYFIKKDLKIIKIIKNLDKQLCNSKYEYDFKDPDIVFCIGGDGTVLNAIQKYINNIKKISFFCFHVGGLGFLNKYKYSKDFNVIKAIENSYKIKTNLIELQINNKKFYALNEFVISNNYNLFEVDINIQKNRIMKFSGSGICFSTSSGSTGYNKSLNGPIVSNKLQSLIITFIAPINNSLKKNIFNSLVLSKEEEVKLSSFIKNKYLIILRDGKFLNIKENIDKINIKYSNLYVSFFADQKENILQKITKIK